MKFFGSIELAENTIEFVSYSPDFKNQVLNVIRNSFFLFETVSIGSGIDKSLDAQKDLEGLCEDVLRNSAVSIVARDVEKDLVVGVALNLIQVVNFLSISLLLSS